jgi:hypothetical protein
MVANGRSANPLPSSLFQVWKNCGNRRCCNPDHLYLTNPDGEEASVEDAEEWLRWMESQEAEGASEAPAVPSTQVPSAVSLEVKPQGGKHRAPEVAEPSTPEPTHAHSPRSLAERLNELFDEYPSRDGSPLTSSDAAAALQEDGLAVAAESIDRIRNGASGGASDLVLEALAYFFNVDVDYFTNTDTSARAAKDEKEVNPQLQQPVHSSAAVQKTETPRREPRIPETSTPTPRKQIFPITVVELGRIVTGLSEAVLECLARNPQDGDRAARLALDLAEVGELITRPSDSKVISRPLLNRVVRDLEAVGYVTRSRESLLPRLKAILDGD